MMNSRREGFALVVTMLAMLVVGAIVSGGFYAASQESQITKSLSHAEDAFQIAEAGLNTTMATTSARSLDSIAVNGFRNVGPVNITVNANVRGRYSVRISRVGEEMFVFESTANVLRGGRNVGAERKLASAGRLRHVDFDNQAAVVVYGDLTVGGNSEVDGLDSAPFQWAGEDCPPLTTGTSAVLTNPGTTIATQGSGDIDGPITNAVLNAGTFTVFGDLTWNDLVAMRDKYYPTSQTVNPAPSVSLTVCNPILNNWGDPLNPVSPCFNYMPIIHVGQNLRISSSGSGQGILLVEGDLEISGGFTFYGVVVVKGEIRITGTGGHINGTAMVFGGGSLDSSSAIYGNALLAYNSCAIERAVLNSQAQRAVPIRHRSWVDATAVQDGN